MFDENKFVELKFLFSTSANVVELLLLLLSQWLLSLAEKYRVKCKTHYFNNRNESDCLTLGSAYL